MHNDIKRHNRNIPSRRPEKTLLNYNDKIITNLKNTNTKPVKKTKYKYSHCKVCGDELKHPFSKNCGYCPLCDML